MRKLWPFLFLCFLTFTANVSAQTSLNIDLLGKWSQDSLIVNTSTQVRYGDCFGFVWQGREYAVAASTEGTHVFELTSDNQFVPKGFVKGRFSSVTVSHRDYATYQNYLYAVCDEGKSSLQIIDLSYLPDSIHLAKEDTLQFGRVHNIFIDSLTQTFYSCIHRSTVSTTTIDSPLKVFSLADPLNLAELWAGPNDIPEVHDIYVRDGRAILNCGFDGLRVYDFSSDPTDPAYLDSKTFYTDQGYNHQGWLSPSGNTYVFADETNGKRVKKCAVNGSNITIQSLFGTNQQNGSVPHNIVCTDTFAFVAYYNEGFRIFDLRTSPPVEIAHYDTYPDEHPFKQNGNWGIYAQFPSGRILVSDRQYGLFLLGFNQSLFSVQVNPDDVSIYPNPVISGGELLIRLPETIINCKWDLLDNSGRIVQSGNSSNASCFYVTPQCSAGNYHVRVRWTDYLDEEQESTVKIVVL